MYKKNKIKEDNSCIHQKELIPVLASTLHYQDQQHTRVLIVQCPRQSGSG